MKYYDIFYYNRQENYGQDSKKIKACNCFRNLHFKSVLFKDIQLLKKITYDNSHLSWVFIIPKLQNARLNQRATVKEFI